jgi:hypothetical protein
MTIWNILRPFGIIYGLLVQFVVIWYVWTEKNLATLLIPQPPHLQKTGDF